MRMKKFTVFIVICFVAIGGIYIWFEKQNDFSTEKWIAEPFERGKIVDDLLTSYQLVGMTKQEIVKLLGPDGEPTDLGPIGNRNDNTLAYNLGPEPGFISIDDAWLVIYFDEDNRVSEYIMATD
ncbi:hypothetical protein DRW41_08605 [Neobacillus piezotolerans]|uniref:Outer membrane protein assembly factor BamE n=1 Tax=Neobacillus piezotolerans TaxID=2259171 RepID=A0A3D8GTZ9_9BACI|nr:hypothetical protein [Neobacillus piezotolerans]RDU37867.1 hypothetical protein DRW41_08605 [Neobacillus piezotolerans]